MLGKAEKTPTKMHQQDRNAENFDLKLLDIGQKLGVKQGLEMIYLYLK